MIKKYKLKNGDTRYMFQIYVGTDKATGKQKRTTRRGFKTKKEAELSLARLRLKVANNEIITKKYETFNDVYQAWIQIYEGTVEESTFVKTETIFKLHILPSLGKYRISEITIDICQKEMNNWTSYYKNYYKLKSYASRVFKFAITRNIIERDPFDYVIVPNKPKELIVKTIGDGNFYTKEELIRFLDCAKKSENTKVYTFFHLLAYTGMRKGEALALVWKDINFKEQNITIKRALSQGKDNRLYIKAPKTGDMRVVSIDKQLIQVLYAWKKEQKDMNRKLGYNRSDSKQLIFPNRQNDYLQLSKTNTWIKRIQRAHNLKEITTHGLRHTHCTLLFEAGASLHEVQNRLGHSDSKTTMNIYTHITEKTQKNAMDAFTRYIAN